MIFKLCYIIIFLLFISNHSYCYETKDLKNLKSSKVELIPENIFPSPLLNNLIYISGLNIRSDHFDFGGLSGLIINKNNTFTAIGDQGIWITGNFNFDSNGKLISISDNKLGYLKDENGKYLIKLGKSYTDAEAIELYEDKFIVSFERNHRILSYNNIDGISNLFYDKINLLDLPSNGGIEAMTPLKDNSIFLLSENLVVPNDKIVAFRLYEKKLKKIFVKKNGSFKPTDLSALPSGDILMLERSYSPVEGAKARISLIRHKDLMLNSLINPIYLDVIEPPMIVDNFEAISFLSRKGGGYDIFILSDDNFNPLQKTLLFQFYWDGKLD